MELVVVDGRFLPAKDLNLSFENDLQRTKRWSNDISDVVNAGSTVSGSFVTRRNPALTIRPHNIVVVIDEFTYYCNRTLMQVKRTHCEWLSVSFESKEWSRERR